MRIPPFQNLGAPEDEALCSNNFKAKGNLNFFLHFFFSATLRFTFSAQAATATPPRSGTTTPVPSTSASAAAIGRGRGVRPKQEPKAVPTTATKLGKIYVDDAESFKSEEFVTSSRVEHAANVSVKSLDHEELTAKLQVIQRLFSFLSFTTDGHFDSTISIRTKSVELN